MIRRYLPAILAIAFAAVLLAVAAYAGTLDLGLFLLYLLAGIGAATLLAFAWVVLMSRGGSQ